MAQSYGDTEIGQFIISFLSSYFASIIAGKLSFRLGELPMETESSGTSFLSQRLRQTSMGRHKSEWENHLHTPGTGLGGFFSVCSLRANGHRSRRQGDPRGSGANRAFTKRHEPRRYHCHTRPVLA